MSFCSNCGSILEQGARFCSVCGKETGNGENSDRDYNAKPMRCPNCGAALQAFSGKCRFCDVELSNLSGSESVKQFSQKLALAGSDAQRIILIKGFPIPNTKEDIFEYMILAASNIGYSSSVYDTYEADDRKDFEAAWIAKLMQCYQKARLVYADDSDFIKVKKVYDETMTRIENAGRERELKKIGSLAVKNAGVIFGDIAAFLALLLDLAGKNNSLIVLTAVIFLIASACTLKKRDADHVSSGIVAVSGLLLIVLSFGLKSGAMFLLGGAVVLISTAVYFFQEQSF